MGLEEVFNLHAIYSVVQVYYWVGMVRVTSLFIVYL